MSFADGSSAEGDVLVGADGIHSAIRGLIDPSAPAPRYTGLAVACGYAADSPAATEVGAYDMCYGNRAFFGHTTGPDGRDWWFARVPGPELTAADLDAPDDEWRRRIATAFDDDGTPAGDIVRATRDGITVTCAYDIRSLPAWHNDSMIVIGDAAHAASPSTAQGASMALEDAVVLAQCLRDIRRFRELSRPANGCAASAPSVSSARARARPIPAPLHPVPGPAIQAGCTGITSTGTRP